MIRSNRIDFKLILGLVLAAGLIFVTFNYTKSFWYMYGAAMLFLLSFGIFNVNLSKQSSVLKGLIPAIFSAVILYIVFYIGAFILKFMPFGLNSAVHSAFNKFSTDNWIIWILMIIAIVPGEEIFLAWLCFTTFIRFLCNLVCHFSFYFTGYIIHVFQW
ncbi:hypothetical protein MAQA_06423 [Listeria aquatica FSL S10-1188]|uniref:CPBP family intramembrane metalloprotease n=1 Tax=Listeria aquatica FSL S10-1188 TaxID=1265818 RepID=W7B1M6_9LIST|nr:hypothetical protein [Listeria aquatica]EUJ19777.1 hypothetical protein MAQA_06423 [Listeria aquatica FSL S10-1188]